MKCVKLFFVVLALLSFCAAKTQAATSSILIDAQSGSILYADNADTLRYPASLTKLMTLYITFNALENGTLSLDDNLKVSRNAANRSPSRLGLIPGKTIDVRTAILATIIKSANDCATVLGESLAKDEKSFAVLMTETAHELGMKDTTFKNASGLPNSQQKTTARDMAILAAALYHHFPQYYSWFSIPQFEYDGRTYKSHNDLLKDFDGADGLKTGYTAASGYNIVTSARRGNHRVIAVTMGHDFSAERDKKVYAMMDKALGNMELSSLIDYNRLHTEIDTAAPQTKSVKTATKSYASKTSKSGNWAIQIGSFGSYTKAQTHAQKIKNKLAGKFAIRGSHIEKVTTGGKTIYRSKLIGLAKADASRACAALKRGNQACMVTTFTPNSAYAQN